MHGKFIERKLTDAIMEAISYFKVTAVLGPRQVGKSTLIRALLPDSLNILYLDLEKLSDLKKLDHPEFFFQEHKEHLICLDEIQRRPDLFPVLRSIVDEHQRPGQVIILGSASPLLLKQSSETLAGRIAYFELTPFLFSEVGGDFATYWMRGGFPDSFLAPSEKLSIQWRKNFIDTFLQRDIPNLGLRINPVTLQRFWSMAAHFHSEIINFSKIASSLDLNINSIRHYTEIMQATYIFRLLQPYHKNIKKRVVKSPKLYFRDVGILHAIMNISSLDELMGHPIYGGSFEGVVVENVLSFLQDWDGYFYRTQGGAEIDLILEKGSRRIAIECKATKAPKLSKGFYMACEDLNIDKKYVICLVDDMYTMPENITVCNLDWFLKNFEG